MAVPTLLTSHDALEEQLNRLEVHFLANAAGELYFALLTDWTDSGSEEAATDEPLLEAALTGIAALNRKYADTDKDGRFILLHRRRVWNGGEQRWMGWERKRGKLHEFNMLLQGAADTTYMVVGGKLPAHVRYVITLDADTRLPRDAAQKLVGKLAHPLNRPIMDRASGRVVAGHAVLQPRVTPALPSAGESSMYQRTFSSPHGLDPYVFAVSDVYQDLFDEGSFAGKGIYDVQAFSAALDGRVPENSLLSHDLFEGIFARAGLVSDIEVIEEQPSRYEVAAAREHRWLRGDWQLLAWLWGSDDRAVANVPTPFPCSATGKSSITFADLSWRRPRLRLSRSVGSSCRCRRRQCGPGCSSLAWPFLSLFLFWKDCFAVKRRPRRAATFAGCGAKPNWQRLRWHSRFRSLLTRRGLPRTRSCAPSIVFS